jgi:hypothetical protein
MFHNREPQILYACIVVSFLSSDRHMGIATSCNQHTSQIEENCSDALLYRALHPGCWSDHYVPHYRVATSKLPGWKSGAVQDKHSLWPSYNPPYRVLVAGSQPLPTR